MNSIEKSVSYTHTNSYSTLNNLHTKTKNVWIVFHGIGYLSRYFLRYFDELPASENYIIAPQAPSKYYLKDTYSHVGASWLTKENTVAETANLIHYINAVLETESIPTDCRLVVLGFSQGVSVATRWVAKKKVKCDVLALYAGGLPTELRASGFSHLEQNKTKVYTIIGTKDAYLTPARLVEEEQKAISLFQGKAEQIRFDGGHEIKKEIINSLIYR